MTYPEKFDGYYYIAKQPVRLAQHNLKSWNKIEQLLSSQGWQASFQSLCESVKDHEHGNKSSNHPYQFITYCIRSKWLAKKSD